MPVDPVSLVVALVVIAALATVIAGTGTVLWIVSRLFAIPGVVTHEFAHKWACNLVGVAVLEVVYFRFGNPPGYVRHAQPRRYRESFVVSVAPFLVNSVVSFAAFLGLAALVAQTGDVASLDGVATAVRTASSETLALAVAFGWLGLSVGMHAFPSTGDANTLWDRSRAEWRRSPIVLLGIPVVVVIYLVNLLSRLGADVVYALALALAAFVVVGPIGL